jgi:hypothetical protein
MTPTGVTSSGTCRAARTARIHGVDLPEEAIERRPSIAVATLTHYETLTEVLRVFDWAFERSKAAAAAADK